MKKILFVLIPFYLFTTSFVLPKIQLEKQNLNTDSLTISKNFNQSENTKISKSQEVFSLIDFTNEEKLDETVFEKAFKGFEKLKIVGQLPEESHLLTIVDFSKSSNKNRLWVIDLENKKVLFNALVAHGMGTGEEFAEHFSNRDSSHQSSLGFYITEATYTGNNGYSLRLMGVDKGFNDAALQRSIVMHGADYVSANFATAHKRIGRSWGCPAVSRDLAEPIINTIKGKNCLFIYYPDNNYLKSSEWLKS
ncbi:MAG: murein L,D-transpeptidase catalytic domain family protein [Chryseobacterium sp.]|nr:murein L,D-transpeptidase catalytic domain family protein [Chryseobacterium sp.]